MKKYKPVIGLEIHVELKTKSKMFCQCAADYFGQKPNTRTCPVCLGLPGALPVPNRKAVEWTILMGYALGCKINRLSKFDRKHYFYPDLVKGYQISQYDQPLAIKGQVILAIPFSGSGNPVKHFNDEIASSPVKRVPRNDKIAYITRVHLEEDTGKLIHKEDKTLIDFNRSGVPLVEIVTEPDFDNADDVKHFLEELQVIIRYLGISDADMEKGTMRLEPNISLKVESPSFAKVSEGKPKSIKSKVNNDLPNYKVEIKNINSFRFVKQAIKYEIERQTEILEKGETPKQETRGYDEKKQITYSQRSKEEAHDYRYFPEPDIPPMSFSDAYLEGIKKSLPELPYQKVERYQNKFGLNYQEAFILTRDRDTYLYYENIISNLKSQISNPNLKSTNIYSLIAKLIVNKKLSTDLTVEEFIKRVTESVSPVKTDIKTLDVAINRLIEINKKAVEDYKGGKQNALMFLVGQVMREMKGKADAKLVIKEIKNKLT